MNPSTNEPEEVTSVEQLELQCVCGRQVELDMLDDYDLPTFAGACVCGRVWTLSEISGYVSARED